MSAVFQPIGFVRTTAEQVPRHWTVSDVEGSLVIDLIDPATNTLVGEGGAQSRIRSTDFTQQQIDEIVGKIMSELLPR